MDSPKPRAANTIEYHAVWLLLGIGVAGFAWLMSVRPDGETITLPLVGQLPELCTLKRTFEIDCPGCGLTRSIVALVGGDVTASWRYNPMGMAIFAVLIYQIPYRAIAITTLALGKPFRPHPGWVTSVVVFTLAGGLVLQWIWRFIAQFV